MNSTHTTEAGVARPQSNDDNRFIQALTEEEKILVPEEKHKPQTSPTVKIIFPSHPHKSTMESYLSRGLYSDGPDYEPPGKLYFAIGLVFDSVYKLQFRLSELPLR